MNNQIIHNFCESRLNYNKSPEFFNTITSFIISLFPFIFGFPENISFYNSTVMLILNGITSFYYHYSLNYIGKQSDEIAMILVTYYTIFSLINIKFYEDKSKIKRYNLFNLGFAYIFIVLNTDINFDFLFPYFFSLYLIPLIYLVIDIGFCYNIFIKYELFISSFGALSWIISELFCNNYTKFGHVIWHILFPLGYYKVVLKFDKIYTKIKSEDEIKESY
tara:strand:+ start:2040 stop:2699 length:660 start_codon:yes stop_codon:yes gene_type:complete